MGFGVTLGKQIAMTGANALTGGLVNGIMGLFGGNKKAEQRQYQHEKEMMALQNKYNTQAAAQSMEYAKTMNQINFEQQNQMFDKQAEWHSPEQQKQRLKEAGLNPGLMYGIGGEGGSSVSSGGGTGSEVQGVGNPGTQAVMMGLQAKSIESQIALNNAQASKINAETEKTEKETEKTSAETESVWSGIELLKKQTSSEEAKIKLTNMQTELTEAMREESWSNWEKARAGVAEISRIMEKLDKEIEGMGFDNEIKNKSKEAIIGNYFADLKVKGQQIIESNSKVKLNEKQMNVFDETINDIKSTVTNRDMTEEARRKSIDTEVNYMLYKMGLEGQQNVREWIYEGINAVSKLMPYGK
uniref:DNA pilot protein n=2 Tax=Dulem virus 213 TaxID=3145690 RepID=A0AAU8B3C7_9VIRU